MVKGIMMLIIAGGSGYFIYKSLSEKATGPFTKQVQLFWSGEDCGIFGKAIVIAVPLGLLGLINKIL
ncbi:MAG: hypothetical protein H6Q66_1941 [Firmicutes bacterium]|nr:hypothetical protein [Bacillota bacterium]